MSRNIYFEIVGGISFLALKKSLRNRVADQHYLNADPDPALT
jgi:hypothetical protein